MGDLPKPVRVKESSTHLNVLYGGVSLVKVSKATLTVFLADLGPDMKISVTKEKTGRKKRKSRSSISDETKTNAKQLVRAYTENKKKFFHSNKLNGVSVNSPDFKYFVEAITIIKRHGVTYKKFLKAQIAGLGFASNGIGVFPKPIQLSNDAAETRLLEYLRQHDGRGVIPVIKISKEERETRLMQNSKYLLAYDKVKDKTATLEETVYVREMQLIRKGVVRKSVEKYLERFTQ